MTVSRALSRRDFLKIAGMTSASLALSACGVKPVDLPPTTSVPPTMAATVLPSPTLAPTATPTPNPGPDMNTLRGLAEQLGMSVGVLLSPDLPETLALQASQFNFGTVTSTWGAEELSPGVFDFGWPDDQLRFAVSNQMKAKYHGLFKRGVYPDWLLNGNFTRSEVIERMKIYLETVIQHFEAQFPGSMTQYVVVNEPTHGREPDFLYDTFGEDYLKVAFGLAREVTAKFSPSSKLLYNHNKNHATVEWNGVNFELTLKDVEALKADGLIDGVGVQAHMRGYAPPDKADMLQAFRAYNMPVYITECDVSLVKMDVSKEQKYLIQADIYRSLVEAALESGVCKSISFWGAGDKYSWLEKPEFAQHAAAGPDADPTLFDDQLNPKPAYFAVLSTLKEQLPK